MVQGSPARLRTELWLQQRLLRLAGQWTPRARLTAWLYAAYAGAVVASLLFLVASQLSAMLHFWGDILSATNNACVTSSYSMAVFKFFAFRVMRPSAERLIHDLDRCLQVYGQEYAVQKAAVFGACAQKGRLVARLQVSLGVSVYLSWVVLPALRAQACHSAECRVHSGFPALVWYPFSFTEPPVYQMIYAVISMGLFYGCIIFTSQDGFFWSLIIYVGAHLRFLNFMVTNMSSGESDTKSPGGSPQLEEKMRRRLKECVCYHNDIDRCVQRLSSLLGPVMLGQFLTDIVTISASAFVATMLKADSGWLLKYGSYLSGTIEHMFLFCWFGNDILTESERLQLSAYSSDWADASPRFRKELRIFLCRSQRPLILTASKFCAISRQTFLRLMNASYSYFALLNQLSSE
ncbi:odorant receptor Or2-like [Schistocerca americana]|nr:odorant receptor Or2-like [Schistocerca americana]